MVEGLLLGGAIFASVCGMGWLALAKPPHWQQAGGREPPSARARRVLHGLGAAALALSLLLCLAADHASMAALVWVMTASGAALLVTFTLAYRPRWLSWLAGFNSRRGATAETRSAT